MPLLPAEPFLFPEDVLMTSIEGASPWWVLHTRPRAEKSLVRRLWRRRIGFFLPLYRRQWSNRGRVLCSHVPLFPGYVFLQGDNQQRLEALGTNLVARCLRVEDQQQLHADLQRVYRLMASGAPLAPEERLIPGAPVEIHSGPFAGMEGKILRRGKLLKLLIEVQFLQRGVSVEIDSWMIQPLFRKAHSVL